MGTAPGREPALKFPSACRLRPARASPQERGRSDAPPVELCFVSTSRCLQEKLYEELKGHLKETDTSAPFPKGPWLYFHSTTEGLSYKVGEDGLPTHNPASAICLPTTHSGTRCTSAYPLPCIPTLLLPADALPQAPGGLCSGTGHP